MSHQGPGNAQLEEEIARTREDLAETVDELIARLDVKSRLSEQARRPRVIAVGAGLLAATVVLLVVRRRRGSR